MRIDTSCPVLRNPEKINQKISKFWDKISGAWKEVVGQHIHHGIHHDLSDFNTIAQETLIDKLAELIELQPKALVLDVGCGMGGTSIHLAEKYQASVTGISLSEAQVRIAQNAVPAPIRDQLHFKVEDAHVLRSFSDNTFDLLWSLESCEQFYDKEKFIAGAYRVLKPGGKLMIASWCSDKEFYEDKAAKNYVSLCKTFDLPYMPTVMEYKRLLSKYFEVLKAEDWSTRVSGSLEKGMLKLKGHSWFKLFRLAGILGVHFIVKLKLLRNAFASGQLRYGVFVCVK